MISIKFQNNKHEYAEAMNIYYSKVKKRNIDIGIGLLFSVIAIILFVFDEQSYLYTILFIVGVSLIIFTLLQGRLASRLRFIRDKKFIEEYKIDFDEDGIHFQTNLLKSDIKWNYYYSIWESEKFFLLFYGKGSFSLIPKRSFENIDKLNDFKELVKKSIPEYQNI